MRPVSATLLPVSTTSTGLLCLSVGAHVHRVRSDTELSVWLLPHAHHIQCVTYMFLYSFVNYMLNFVLMLFLLIME